MSKPTNSPALTGEELEQQTGAPLPDREAMSTIDVTGSGVDNFAVPINEATAVNVNSDYSYAIADADQIVILDQTDVDGPDETTEELDKHPNKDK